MKSTLLKLTLPSVLTLCFASNVHAYDHYLGYFKNDQESIFNRELTLSNPKFDVLNETHFGNAATKYAETKDKNYVIVPGHYHRFGIFKLEKKDSDGKMKDLTFSSKEKAINFCGELIDSLTPNVNPATKPADKAAIPNSK